MRKIFVFLSLMLWISGAAAQQAAVSLEPDTNRPGMDYRSLDLEDARPELCRQACERDEKCRAYTYIKPGIQGPRARCWLKSGVPTPQKGACCVSGVKTAKAEQGQSPKAMKYVPGDIKVPPKSSAGIPGSQKTGVQSTVSSGKGGDPRLKVPPVSVRRPEKPLNRGELVNILIANPLTAPRLNQVASTMGIPAKELASKSTSGKLVTGGPETLPTSGATKYLNWEAGVRFTPRSIEEGLTVSGVTVLDNFSLSEMYQRNELLLYGKPEELEINFRILMPPGKYAITIELTGQFELTFNCSNCNGSIENPFPVWDNKALTEGISTYTGYVEVPKEAQVSHSIDFKKSSSILPVHSIFRGITFTRL